MFGKVSQKLQGSFEMFVRKLRINDFITILKKFKKINIVNVKEI